MSEYYTKAVQWLATARESEEGWDCTDYLAAAQVAAGLAQVDAVRELIRDTARASDRP